MEDISASSASKSDAKLIDPNTGEEVKPDSSTKEANKPKTKGKKGGQLVDPNTGDKITDAATADDVTKSGQPASKGKQVNCSASGSTAFSYHNPCNAVSVMV